MNRRLAREEVTPHPWRFHDYRPIDAALESSPFSLVEQCSRCNRVRVENLLTSESVSGSHAILKERS